MSGAFGKGEVGGEGRRKASAQEQFPDEVTPIDRIGSAKEAADYIQAWKDIAETVGLQAKLELVTEVISKGQIDPKEQHNLVATFNAFNEQFQNASTDDDRLHATKSFERLMDEVIITEQVLSESEEERLDRIRDYVVTQLEILGIEEGMRGYREKAGEIGVTAKELRVKKRLQSDHSLRENLPDFVGHLHLSDAELKQLENKIFGQE